MDDIRQRVILNKLIQYMRQDERDPEFIDQFKEGYCAGISSLWLYAKRLQLKPKTSSEPRDDYDWFQKIVRAIVRWDGKSPLDKNTEIEFDRFISHIQFFQHPDMYLTIYQGELDRSVEDIHVVGGKKEIGKVIQEYSVAAAFTLEQLKQLLQADIIHDRRMIQISSHNHATALFKDGNNYYYFDPNSSVGEVVSHSLDEIAELIFEASSFEYDKPSPLSFKMFISDDEKKESYLSQEQVLDRIVPPISLDSVNKEYANGKTEVTI